MPKIKLRLIPDADWVKIYNGRQLVSTVNPKQATIMFALNEPPSKPVTIAIDWHEAMLRVLNMLINTMEAHR